MLFLSPLGTPLLSSMMILQSAINERTFLKVNKKFYNTTSHIPILRAL